MTRWHERAVQAVGVEGGLEPSDRGDELRHAHRTALYRVEHALARLGRSLELRNSGNGPRLTENPREIPSAHPA